MSNGKNNHTEKITVSFAEDEKEKLKNFCNSENIPPAIMVRKIVIDKIDEETKE